MSIKHHYLPQFYLKGFVNKDENDHSAQTVPLVSLK